MTYVVLNDHPEALQDGRLVENGDRLSDSDAQKNPRLIERGVLVKDETERRKPSHKKQPEQKPEPDAAAAPQKEDESK